MILVSSMKHYGLQEALYGMRLPLRSHAKADTFNDNIIGFNDLELARKLINAGNEHRKFLRSIHVSLIFQAPQFLLREFDTYKVSTTTNSSSQMHTIMKRHLTVEDFSMEDLTSDLDRLILTQTINYCNSLIDMWKITKEEKVFRKLQQILPQSYMYERVFTCNMEVLYNIYKHRKSHKLKEWRDFCAYLENYPLFKQLFLWEDK